MNYLPTLRKLSAVLVLAGAGLSINAMLGIAPAAGQAATPAAAAPTAAPAAATPAEPTAGDPARGFLKAATCLGCHSVPGYKASFPTVYRVPMIGGQNAKYIENALKQYQKGERRFPSMMATAKSLSDQDIADVAAFFSSQH
jgi:cytochrome c553